MIEQRLVSTIQSDIQQDSDIRRINNYNLPILGFILKGNFTKDILERATMFSIIVCIIAAKTNAKL